MNETQAPLASRRPSIRGVNLTLLIAIVLFLSLGSLMQLVSLLWGTIGAEICTMLLPVSVYILIKNLPYAESIRWRWPGWKLLLVAAVLGAGMMVLTANWGLVVSEWITYDLPLSPELFPRTISDSLVLLLALSVTAPISEEILFRGFFQQAHEHSGALRAIVLSTLLFAGFHMSMLRFIILLPVSFMFAYVAWRTRSVLVTIVMHSVYNGISAVSTILSTHSAELLNQEIEPSMIPWVISSLVIAAGLYALHRWSTPPDEPLEAPRRSLLGRSWPLVPVVLLLIGAMGVELVMGLRPDLLATRPLVVTNSQATGSWTYDLQGPADSALGSAAVQVTNSDELLHIAVGQQITGELPVSTTAPLWINQQTEYGADANSLTSLNSSLQLEGTAYDAELSWNDTRVSWEVSGGASAEAEMSQPLLVAGEWPWRMSALDFGVLATWKVTLAKPVQDENGAVVYAFEDTLLRVRGAEPVAVPAGIYVAWRVTVGDATAWYDSEAPHTLVRYEENGVIWQLSEATGEK